MWKLVLAAGLFLTLAAPAAAQSTHRSYSGATASFAGAGAPGEWTSQARDYANTRYSPLDQINSDNVGRLKIAWTFSDGTQYGHEGAPLVIGDTMYLVAPYPASTAVGTTELAIPGLELEIEAVAVL